MGQENPDALAHGRTDVVGSVEEEGQGVRVVMEILYHAGAQRRGGDLLKGIPCDERC